MSGPIQVIPPGLLGFFQLKNNGENPRELPSILQAVLECRDWYFMAKQELQASFTSTRSFVTANRGWFPWNGGATGPIVVPDKEAWYVRSYSVAAQTIGAGDSCSWRAAYTPLRTGTIAPFGLTERAAATAGNTSMVTSNGFFLVPGSELGVYIEDCTSAAGVILFGNVVFTRLPL